MAKKVVAAMSGGVDSAVAAFLLKEQGYDVIGVTLRLAPDHQDDTVTRTGRCCSIDDMSDARMCCDKIGIPFYAIDAQAKFKEAVFDPFVTAYQNGITPIPCLACNHTVKFGDLYKTAKDLKAQLATGHYARLATYKGEITLARPYDQERDQTYYLYGTDPGILPELSFPLGELLKSEVRALARKIGLLVHDKKDSHEICFVPDGNHARVVEKALNKKFSGEVVNEAGHVIGLHEGVHHFTIGQRRGVGIASKERQFVLDIDANSQQVVLGKKSSLACSEILVSKAHFLVPFSLWPEKVLVKIRARSQPEIGSVVLLEKGELKVIFDSDIFGVALGQAAVFYDGDNMLGGGLLSGRLNGAFPRQMACS